MSTSWKSQVAQGDYRIQFETDNYEMYRIVEKACCAVIDTPDKDAAIKKIEVYIEEARKNYFNAMENKLADDEIAYRQGVVRGMLDAFYALRDGGTSEK